MKLIKLKRYYPKLPESVRECYTKYRDEIDEETPEMIYINPDRIIFIQQHNNNKKFCTIYMGKGAGGFIAKFSEVKKYLK